jgi:hypothetical protein
MGVGAEDNILELITGWVIEWAVDITFSILEVTFFNEGEDSSSLPLECLLSDTAINNDESIQVAAIV